ncbi:MAG: hypothetical protein GH144_01610 [Clostridia bacterium]|jgi:sugar phosphate isomerase/epimerase|nr:hypothetical protein [Clostridia bacterium]
METIKNTPFLLNYFPSLRFYVDTAHYILIGSIGVVKKFGHRIGYIHLKDYFQPKGEKKREWSLGNFVELGKGNIGLDF